MSATTKFSTRRKVILIGLGLVGLCIAVCAGVWLERRNLGTRKAGRTGYFKIREDMTVAEVEALLGGPGKEEVEDIDPQIGEFLQELRNSKPNTRQLLIWRLQRDHCVFVYFLNDTGLVSSTLTGDAKDGWAKKGWVRKSGQDEIRYSHSNNTKWD